MRGALLVGVCLVISAVVIGAAAASTNGPGAAGGPPTRPLGPPDEGTQNTPSRVIGTGHAYDGWVEIDAYGWKPESNEQGEAQQFCAWIEYARSRYPSYGSCLGAGEIDRPVTIEDVNALVKPKRLRYVEIGGALSPDVARVIVSFQRPGRSGKHRVNATVAQVSGALQGKLKQPAPFGFFVAKIRGHIRFKTVRATGFDAAGSVIGSTRGLGGHVITVARTVARLAETA